MKKHLFGFVLFSLIVGTSAFGYAMFNVVRVDEVPAPNYFKTYSPATSCWKMKKDLRKSNFDSPKVSQAVLNLQTEQISLKLEMVDMSAPTVLHFFVKDAQGTRYIASEQFLVNGRGSKIEGKMNMQTADAVKRLEDIEVTASYSTLDNLNSYENLYLIAESGCLPQMRNNFQPKFDPAKAAPVLIDSGR
jgi:hypothetical protein